jgi:hypothetical protein
MEQPGIRCQRCGTTSPAGHTFCDSCGSSLNDYSPEIEALYLPKLKKARGWILAVGILYGVSGLILSAVMRRKLGDELAGFVLMTNLALMAIHIGLWAWAKRAPFAAAVVALVLYITVHLAEAVSDPSSIARGLLIKIIFLSALIQAIKAGLEIRRLQAGAQG